MISDDDLTSPSLTVLVVSLRSHETAFSQDTLAFVAASAFTAFVAVMIVCSGIETLVLSSVIRSSKNPNVTAAVADDEPFNMLSATLVTLSSHMITAGS